MIRQWNNNTKEDESKSRTFFSMLKRHSSKSSIKKNYLLGLSSCVDRKSKDKSKSNINLNIRRDESDSRRFSIRSLFTRSGRSHGGDSSKNHHKDSIYTDEIIIRETLNRHLSNSLSQSINSNDATSNNHNNNINSRSTTPVRLLSLSHATGSALKFHHSFKLTNPTINLSRQTKTASDMNVSNQLEETKENFLSLNLNSKREILQKAKEFSCSIANKTVEDEDIDKVFGEYFTKNGIKSISNPASVRSTSLITSNNVNSDCNMSKSVMAKAKPKGPKHLFGLLFSMNKNRDDDNSLADGEFVDHFQRHQRSRTLNSVSKNKLSLFSKRKNSLNSRFTADGKNFRADNSNSEASNQENNNANNSGRS